MPFNHNYIFHLNHEYFIKVKLFQNQNGLIAYS